MNVQKYIDDQKDKEWDELKSRLRSSVSAMNTVLCASGIRHNYNEDEVAQCLLAIYPDRISLQSDCRGATLKDRFESAFDAKMTKRFDETFKAKQKEGAE